jgi:hypothetical protein
LLRLPLAHFYEKRGDAAGWEPVPGNDNIVHATLWSGGHIIDLGILGSAGHRNDQ